MRIRKYWFSFSFFLLKAAWLSRLACITQSYSSSNVVALVVADLMNVSRRRRWRWPVALVSGVICGAVGCGQNPVSPDVRLDEPEDGQSFPNAGSSSGGQTNEDVETGGHGGEGGAGQPTCPQRHLGAALVQHACLHGQLGPFAHAVATTREIEAPPVNAPHTAYLVTAASGGTHWLSFTARVTGEHAFFTDFAGPLALSPRAEHVMGGDVQCASLRHVQVFHLEKGGTYGIGIEHSIAMLVIEELAPFGDLAWASTCACAQADSVCEVDEDCCSGFCSQQACAVPEPAGCTDASSLGSVCSEPADCCSNNCVAAACAPPAECRSSGPCTSDEECCLFCHDKDHCH